MQYWQAALAMVGIVVVASFSKDASIFILVVLVGLILVAINTKRDTA